MWIGITLGDITGIGPEVTLKALAQEAQSDDVRFLLIGDSNYVRRVNKELGLELPLQTYDGDYQSGRIFLCQPLSDPLPDDLPHGSPVAAKAAIAWLKDGAERCLYKDIGALVTAPVSKEAIIKAGISFVGQTEHLSAIAGTKLTTMMLLGHDDRDRWLRVALATTHVPIKKVAEQISKEKVERAIDHAAQACVDLGLPRARVAVCGLNPHAGEGGQIGDEEVKIIEPAVRTAQHKGVDVFGPIPADTLFHSALKGSYDAIVAMYHDQGLAPLKMVAFESGVNWTLGLPFIRTSPDHGTAYDIAGKGIADASSMIAAIRLAKFLVVRKNQAPPLKERATSRGH